VTHPARIAVVTQRETCRRQVRSWMPLIADRAELRLCESPLDPEAVAADVLAVDEACPGLEQWLARAASERGNPESLLVFATTAHAAGRGVIPWGRDGAEVLAAVCDVIERRELLREADAFVKELRRSTNRLDVQRRRFARLVLERAEALRGANVDLTRELGQLTRLQSIARFFMASSPDEAFGDGLAEVAGRTLSASGLAVYRRAGDEYALQGKWRLSTRGALAIRPAPGEAADVIVPRPSSRKGQDAWWIPLGKGARPAAALGMLVPAGQLPAQGSEQFLDSARALIREGLQSRSATESLVSLQRQSERILSTLRGALLQVDADDRVTLANPACAAILGRSVAEIEGRTLAQLLPRDHHLRELLASVRAEGGPLDDVETFVTDADGLPVAVSVRASPFPEAPGGREGILVLLTDLSRRKEVEEEARRAERLGALGRLSASVAHEIRNPLAGIRTTAELLRSRLGDDEDRQRFVDVILEETGRLNRIVDSLLQFAKPPTPQLAPLAVGRILEKTRELAAGKAVEKRVTIRTDVPAGIAEPLADRDQILQVLLNLLLNAVEASPLGGEIRVLARQERGRSGERIRIVVEDEGDGVPALIQERVFDPFFTTKPGGTGLGLSISRHIVQQHGGTLRLERHRDGLTCATLTLPLATAPADDSGLVAAGAGEGSRHHGGGPWRRS
jgi:PAS domain S-box-containing protein